MGLIDIRCARGNQQFCSQFIRSARIIAILHMTLPLVASCEEMELGRPEAKKEH